MDDRKCSSIDRRSTIWYGANIGKSPSFSHNMDSDQKQWTTAQRNLDKSQRNVAVLTGPSTGFKNNHQNKLTLHSRENPNQTYDFPLYEDSRIGIHGAYQDFLCEAYEQDDDIDTKSSVMNHFIKVCADDIRDGVMLNQEEIQKEGAYERAQRLYTSSEPCRKIIQEQQVIWSQKKQI
ncbi:hypothetical protein pb186bvf_015494 [Paramecium bursaria]